MSKVRSHLRNPTFTSNRFLYFFISWPNRFFRLIKHLFVFLNLKNYPDESWSPFNILKNLGFWFLGAILLIADLFAIPEFYENMTFIFKSSTRPLTTSEKEHAVSIFGNEILLNLVRIDERAHLGSKEHGIVYVGFHTINAWGKVPMHLLIHELVHVWQYEQFGSAYISHALKAQQSKNGYNYGGSGALAENMSLEFYHAFNYEQQAEIVEDYYRMTKGLTLRWIDPGGKNADLLRFWVRQINPAIS